MTAGTLPPQPGGPPVFLLGFPRSGTTLLRVFLDAHPDLAIPFESFVLIDFAKRAPRYGNLATGTDRRRLVEDLLGSKGIRSWNPRVEPEDFDLDRCGTYAAIVEQLFAAYARRCGKPRWGDKTPSYTRDFHVLYELFPQAKFLHLIRDGRDAAVSLVRQQWGPGDYLTALSQWNEVVTWSRKMGRMLPRGQYLEVRFEDLTADPEAVLRQIAAFLELPYDPRMLEGQASAGEKLPLRSKAFHGNLTRPLDRRLALQWQRGMSAADQALSLRIAGPLLADLGYPVDRVEVSAPMVHLRRAWLQASAAAKWRLRRLRRGRARVSS